MNTASDVYVPIDEAFCRRLSHVTDDEWRALPVAHRHPAVALACLENTLKRVAATAERLESLADKQAHPFRTLWAWIRDTVITA